MSTPAGIYLDYNSTTPVDPAVLEAMLPWFTDHFGNASSTHAHGRRAKAAVEEARSSVATSLGVSPRTIVFTSGATEANNIALRGVRGRVVVVSSEHKAVLETAASLEHSVVGVDAAGAVDLDELDHAAAGASLISVMLANNETGVTQDLHAVTEIARRHGCLVHTDATQALGKLEVDLAALDVDLASVSAHKVYGPKGVGALFVRRGISLAASVTGGGHEEGVRSGTLNVPGIVGFGAAARHIDVERDASSSRRRLDRLVAGLDAVGDWSLNSDHQVGLPNTASISFAGADAEAVLAQAAGVAMSTGSACTAAVPEPSHVLLAMGLSVEAAFETIRISVGRPTTDADVDDAVAELIRSVAIVRELTAPGGHR